MNIEMYNGEAIKIMAKLAKNNIKVDAVITDIPYGTTQCSWDNIIPFDKMWEALKKITREDTPIILFGAEPFSSKLRMSNIDSFKYDIVWEKTTATGHLNAKIQPLRSHEFIHVFYDKQCTYNPIMSKGHKRKVSSSKSRGASIDRARHKNKVYGDENADSVPNYDSTERYPKSIIKFSTDKQKSSAHPTQKPVKLMEYLIKTYTNENDLVLDFTMGSGTTMVACENTKRNGIGVEIDEKYFKIAQCRVLEAKGKVGLFA